MDKDAEIARLRAQLAKFTEAAGANVSYWMQPLND